MTFYFFCQDAGFEILTLLWVVFRGRMQDEGDFLGGMRDGNSQWKRKAGAIF